LKLVGLVVVVQFWWLAAHHTFTFFWSFAAMWGAIALVPILAAIGRRLLDSRPTPQHATLLTIPVHYMEMILYGCALIVAFRFTQAQPIASIPFPKAISYPVLQVLCVLATLTVFDLAIGSFGLPFATALSKKLATKWLYARCRNPMGLFSLLLRHLGSLVGRSSRRKRAHSARRQLARNLRPGTAVAIVRNNAPSSLRTSKG
jgi:hypothetical protein